jgi:hypothetical protein
VANQTKFKFMSASDSLVIWYSSTIELQQTKPTCIGFEVEIEIMTFFELSNIGTMI